jgi:hypothetical protein
MQGNKEGFCTTLCKKVGGSPLNYTFPPVCLLFNPVIILSSGGKVAYSVDGTIIKCLCLDPKRTLPPGYKRKGSVSFCDSKKILRPLFRGRRSQTTTKKP